MQIVVLGMYYSGTSMVTRILNLMGVYFGPEGILLDTNAKNKRESWERRDIYDLNNNLLLASKADWHRVADFSLDQIPESAKRKFRNKARKIILEIDANRPWVLKDPRFCLLFKLWREFLEVPVCIYVHRHPIQIAQSLAQHHRFPTQFGLALWERYAVDAFHSIAGLPLVTVIYEDMLADPIAAAHQLYRDLQKTGVNGLRLPTDREILTFINHSQFYQNDYPDLQDSFIIAEQKILSEKIIDNRNQTIANIKYSQISQGGYQNLITYEKQLRLNTALREQIKINHKLKERLILQSKQLQHTKIEQTTLTTQLQQIRQEHAIQALELEKYIYWAQNLSANFQGLLNSWRQKSGNIVVQILEKITHLQQKSHSLVEHIQTIFNLFERSKTTNLKSTINRSYNKSNKLSENNTITQIQKPRLILLPQLREDKAPAGSAFVRVLLPYNSAAVQQQWRVETNPVDTLPQLGTAEILLIQREALELDITQYIQWINQWKNTGGRLIYELDDDLLDSYSLAKRNHTLNSELVVIKARLLIQHADLVTVSTLPLAEKIRSLNENIVVIQNYLDAHLWKLASPRKYHARDPKRPIKIGYIGTQTHDQDLEVITEAMRRIQETYGSNVTIEIIGAFQNRECLFGTKIPLPPKTDYPSFVHWLLENIHWDIGVIPLFDDEFNKCKSHLKFLEYAALEMAIICSKAPAYQGIARDGINSLVVDNTTVSWCTALIKLIEDQALRERLASAARIEVINRFTIDLMGETYLKTLASIKINSSYQRSFEFQKKVVSTLDRIEEKNPPPPAIIIPVYNAPDEVRNCLESIICHTKMMHRVIVINDASTDPRIHELLDHYKNISAIEIYHNEKNLGYTRTINRGIELAGHADVVFLNSDTQVVPCWLRNLQFAAYSGEKIGTATPFSNNAGAFSAPEIAKENPLPPSLSLAEYGRLVSHISLRSYPTTPTGNGFCMYVRRDCLDETGPLDAQAFPRGYGEENDFCMRAGRLGWTHIIDDATLIYHVRSASFGEEKHELMKQGRKIIDERYPEYMKSVKQLINNESLKQIRERIRHASTENSLSKQSGKPRFLFVVATRKGGVPQTNRDLMTALQDRIDAFVLQGDPNWVALMHFYQGSSIELEKQNLSSPLHAFPHRNDDYDAIIATWLVRYSIELIHIRHIAWHSLGLIKAAKKIGIPVVFSFHDFYTACPTVNLLDENYIFCAGTCTATKGECRHALWKEKDFPALKHAGINTWRKNFEEALRDCDAFITTSESTKRILTHVYPFLDNKNFKIIPHGRDFSSFENLMKSFQPNETIRILLPGNISPSKGEHIITALGKLSTTHHFQIHVLGKAPANLGKNIITHGPYARDEFAEKIREINPHIGGIFSICAETHSHTLTELWACGIPVIGFDLGAVGDRIKKTGGGWLAKEMSASGVIEIIQKIKSSPEELSIKQAAVRAWQDNEGKQHSCDWMAQHYTEIYRIFITGI